MVQSSGNGLFTMLQADYTSANVQKNARIGDRILIQPVVSGQPMSYTYVRDPASGVVTRLAGPLAP